MSTTINQGFGPTGTVIKHKFSVVIKEVKKRKIHEVTNEEEEVEETPKNKKQKSNYIVIHTDGACSSNGSKHAKGGIGVWFGKNDPRNISEAFVDGKATSQRAEIKAALEALKAVDDDDNVELRIDLKNLVSSINTWRFGWEKKGWKTSSGGKVENLDLLKPLFKLIDSRKGKTLVKHIPREQNSGADKLAKQGISK